VPAAVRNELHEQVEQQGPVGRVERVPQVSHKSDVGVVACALQDTNGQPPTAADAVRSCVRSQPALQRCRHFSHLRMPCPHTTKVAICASCAFMTASHAATKASCGALGTRTHQVAIECPIQPPVGQSTCLGCPHAPPPPTVPCCCTVRHSTRAASIWVSDCHLG
jgi:hypothetical protein